MRELEGLNLFAGIIETFGTVLEKKTVAGGARCTVRAARLATPLRLGCSIALNGVCQTVRAIEGRSFSVDVSEETISQTTMRGIQVGDLLNLESEMTLSRGLGGHLLTGHVDGVARILSRGSKGNSECFEISPPKSLLPYLARKGCVALNGISLTVNSLGASTFMIDLIPHTLENTTFGKLGGGDLLNIEVDLIARYVERLLSADGGGESGMQR